MTNDALSVIIENSLVHYRPIQWTDDSGNVRQRALLPSERERVAMIVSNEIERAASEDTANKVMLHRLLSVISPSEDEADYETREVMVVRDAVDSVFNLIPPEYRYAAINALLLHLIQDIGPVDATPLEGACISPALLETLGYIEKLCRKAGTNAAWDFTDDPRIHGKGDLATEVLRLMEGIHL